MTIKLSDIAKCFYDRIQKAQRITEKKVEKLIHENQEFSVLK